MTSTPCTVPAGRVHPLGARPRSFYGPDDWYEGMDVAECQAEIAAEQAEWDVIYRQMPWWRQLLCQAAGECRQ